MKTLDWNKYTEKAIQVAGEGIVMLKNDNNALPLIQEKPVAVFGRIQLHYYKSGTGSGGMVNVAEVIGITDALIKADVKIDNELLDVYKKWDEQNPYDLGAGWGSEPWSQAEMPLDDDIVKKSSQKCDTAIVIIGRTAGEEMDASITEGSFLLIETENDMLEKVRGAFGKVVVLLNVGGIIDMKFVDKYNPDAVLYVWQGGMIGGMGVADVLTGKISPSGKLPDTIAYEVSDYPSDKNFGSVERNFYCEDIYVGYRWFETFAPERVRYPFGFGLSYTNLNISLNNTLIDKDNIIFNISVTNTGEYSGKEVVQVYCSQPQGNLGKPAKILCGFEKTDNIVPRGTHRLQIKVNLYDIASYDDSGVTGNKSCWVLEKGEYTFFIGNSARNITAVYTYSIPETIVLKQCVQAMPPVMEFERIKPIFKNGKIIPVNEKVPVISFDENKRRIENLPPEISYTGDVGIKLSDVKSGKNTMNEFIAQFSDYDLSCIVKGEGMGSPRVTPGTASAFGGVADNLVGFGIPAGCCSDGPSGMRLDCGTKAFSLPDGTMIASTFNRGLITELFEFLALEMSANNVDCLLGAGMNIHRHVLNGRNFEYFSEDPFLTGNMASAELTGLHRHGVTGVIKHFCGNNQETGRHKTDSVISERALREIYLKGFEIAVKSGGAKSIMTTYGSVNGLWTAGNYDLNTTILRNDWGFTGITMTDWWANINSRGKAPDRYDFASMVRAQNDLYMVCADVGKSGDNILQELESGALLRCELQRNAMNICSFIMNTHAMERLTGTEEKVEIINCNYSSDENNNSVELYELNDSLSIDLAGIKSGKGKNHSFMLTVNKAGFYEVTITASSGQSKTAQMPVTLFVMGTASGTFTWNGTDNLPVSYRKEIPLFSRFSAIRLYFAQGGLDMQSIKFQLVREAESIDIAFKDILDK